uniref:glycoside hydrolase family 88 protein n=1 Tax=Fodinicola feengrottensis TaxID=435914 RepID=UPI0013D5B5CD
MRVRRIRTAALLAVTATLASGLLASPASATPLPCPVTDAMISAANYWVVNGTELAANTWQNGSFYTGNLAVVLATGQSNHRTLPWADANGYAILSDPSHPFAPDTQAVGEAYLDLHVYFHPEPENLVPLRNNVLAEIGTGKTTYWGQAEAINRSMPSFARLGVLDSDNTILASMQKLFHYTEKVDGGGLFNETVGLWRHDSGSFTFSSQANGEAFAGLAKVLAALPSTDPRRVEYLRVFRKMAGTIRLTQRPDGFWNTDLLNPLDSPGPESAGTSLPHVRPSLGGLGRRPDARKYEPAA